MQPQHACRVSYDSISSHDRLLTWTLPPAHTIIIIIIMITTRWWLYVTKRKQVSHYPFRRRVPTSSDKCLARLWDRRMLAEPWADRGNRDSDRSSAGAPAGTVCLGPPGLAADRPPAPTTTLSSRQLLTTFRYFKCLFFLFQRKSIKEIIRHKCGAVHIRKNKRQRHCLLNCMFKK